MLKRLTILTLFTGLGCTTSMAHESTTPAAHDHKNFAGFNFGGNIGLGIGNTKVNRQYYVQTTYSDNIDMSTSGVVGGINAGYGWVIPQNYYLGIQAQADYAEVIGNIESYASRETVSRVKLKMQYMYSLYGRIGKVIHNALPYIKIGASFARWQAEVNSSLGPRADSAKTLMGYSVGLGSDFLVSKHLSLGADYTYSRFKRFLFQQPNIIDYNAKPKLHTIMFNVRMYL